MKPKLIIFASGTKDGGGSGFETLVQATKTGVLDADIVAVVSNYEQGGVRQRADKLGIPFVFFSGPYSPEEYQRIVAENKAEWVALSGWLRMVHGLDPRKTINIHPAPLSISHGRFGGAGLYGIRVHEAVHEAVARDEISSSGPTMHFVTDKYDTGPIFFEHRVPITKNMTTEQIAKAVNDVEHEWQPAITNLVVHGDIHWDGKDPHSLRVPDGYAFLPKSH